MATSTPSDPSTPPPASKVPWFERAALGIPAYAAATFVEMHFAGLPVLPAPETPVGLTDPGGSPSR